MNLTRCLVTLPAGGGHRPLWEATAGYTNWLKARELDHDPARVTWMVMVADHLEVFLTAASATRATVEELGHDGDRETFHLLTGAVGSGWAIPWGRDTQPCRSCLEPIRWAPTATGRTIPLDAVISPGGTIEARLDDHGLPYAHTLTGQALTEAYAEERTLWRTHFASCPQAAAHRRPRTPTPRAR